VDPIENEADEGAVDGFPNKEAESLFAGKEPKAGCFGV